MSVFAILKNMFSTGQIVYGISSALQKQNNISLLSQADAIQQKQATDALNQLLQGAAAGGAAAPPQAGLFPGGNSVAGLTPGFGGAGGNTGLNGYNNLVDPFFQV